MVERISFMIFPLNHIVTSANDVMFSPELVCLRACLSVRIAPNHITDFDEMFRICRLALCTRFFGLPYSIDRYSDVIMPSKWRHNERDGISNHQRLDCLLNHLFRRRSMKTSKLHVTGLCEGNSPVNSPHKGSVTRKMFPFDDVIMCSFHYVSFHTWSIYWVYPTHTVRHLLCLRQLSK